MFARLRPVVARLTAALLGLALSGLVSVAMPPPARGDRVVCRMACAGTARCCCRPPAGSRTAAPSSSRSSGPSLQAIAASPVCPKGCAAVRVAPHATARSIG